MSTPFRQASLRPKLLSFLLLACLAAPLPALAQTGMPQATAAAEGRTVEEIRIVGN